MPWETAVDRQARRRSMAEAPALAPEDDKTNVSVIILQQQALFSTWWARAEDSCSIGLAGRFVFSFASAGEPGPPDTAQFGNYVAIPVVKAVFRLVLQHLGPQAPLPTDSPLLSWATDESGQAAVYRYRLLCSDLTRTLPVQEPFASCLNKNGYWLACVGFWNSVLGQIWRGAVAEDRDMEVAIQPTITDECLKLSMDFFTFRFLYGAAVLSADIRCKTWMKRTASSGADRERWNSTALLLVKASCGVSITPAVAQRAGPMFRGLAATRGSEAHRLAAEAYCDALDYLHRRGFGVKMDLSDDLLPTFVKRHYLLLPESCKRHLQHGGVPAMHFGLHVPLAQVDTSSNACPRQEQQTGCSPEQLVPCDARPEDARHDREQRQEERTSVPNRTVPSETPGHQIKAQANSSAAVGESPSQFEAVRSSRETGESDAEEKAPADKKVWSTVYEGRPNTSIDSYSHLREEVERILGERKDPGVYTFVDRGVKKLTRSLRATCKQDACVSCTRQISAAFRFCQGAATLHVRVCGEHGQLQKPKGGHLWNAAEDFAIKTRMTAGTGYTSDKVREALKKAGLPLRCTPRQLNQFVTRKNSAAGTQQVQKPRLIVCGELETASAAYLLSDSSRWNEHPLDRLLVLPTPVFSDDRVCAVWTCPGMLRRAQAAQGKVVKLAIDGKQSVLSNGYTIATLSFLVCSEHVSLTRDARKRAASRPKVHTLTQEPFAQALMNTESEPNVSQFLSTATQVANQHCGLDLAHQVWQLHKDYAKGLEASRRKIFPAARPCDDYPHMRRASYKVLQSLLCSSVPPDP